MYELQREIWRLKCKVAEFEDIIKSTNNNNYLDFIDKSNTSLHM